MQGDAGDLASCVHGATARRGVLHRGRDQAVQESGKDAGHHTFHGNRDLFHPCDVLAARLLREATRHDSCLPFTMRLSVVHGRAQLQHHRGLRSQGVQGPVEHPRIHRQLRLERLRGPGRTPGQVAGLLGDVRDHGLCPILRHGLLRAPHPAAGCKGKRHPGAGEPAEGQRGGRRGGRRGAPGTTPGRAAQVGHAGTGNRIFELPGPSRPEPDL
mmetsp:Transcript_243/g.785  ORF Transcript_243/g.785 Transcript_243/m.785 type:complete len:214 (+) Transcript_243:877-1518(+)